MIHKVRKTVDRHGLLEKGDSIIVAVSGGPDSMALLEVLNRLSPEYGLILMAAHVNHGLRGEESDWEEVFVRDFCRSRGIPFEARTVDIRGRATGKDGSLEEACRRERYRCLDDIRRKENFRKIALGHHLEDQAETLVMRFLRGSGPEGLKGILPRREGVYIRPLIEIDRREILDFLEREGLPFRQDSSNLQPLCLRNRVRLELMPELIGKYNPRLVENLGRTAETLRLENDYMQGVAEDILAGWGLAEFDETAVVDVRKLRGLHEALQRRIIKTILLKASPGKNGIGYRHIRAVEEALTAPRPNVVLDLPFRIRVRREYNLLRFERTSGEERRRSLDESDLKSYCYVIGSSGADISELPRELAIRELGKRVSFHWMGRPPACAGSGNSVFLDSSGILFPLKIRNWLPGDRIEPLGMKGSKKVKDIFIDEKVPRETRKDIPLVVDEKSVLWIAGIRVSERARITDRTGRVLKIEIN